MNRVATNASYDLVIQLDTVKMRDLIHEVGKVVLLHLTRAIVSLLNDHQLFYGRDDTIS